MLLGAYVLDMSPHLSSPLIAPNPNHEGVVIPRRSFHTVTLAVAPPQLDVHTTADVLL